MNKLLFIPGLLFLLVILFRVIIPLLKQPGWKRLLNTARYERQRKYEEKSDRLLLKALEKYPRQPEVYLEYYLNHSDSTDLQSRFSVLKTGWEQTGSIPLGFFLGAALLEEGDLEEAAGFLLREDIADYQKTRRIGLTVQFWMEKGDYARAEETYFQIYDPSGLPEEEALAGITAQDLLPLVLIRKAAGKDWQGLMNRIPRSSIHTDMSWQDCLAGMKDQRSALKPARTGIHGDPGRFNRRRKAYYDERISLIEAHLSA